MGQNVVPPTKPMGIDEPMEVVNEQNESQLEMETEGKQSITGITGSTRLSLATLQSVLSTPPVFLGATTKPGECFMGALVNWNHRGNLVEVGDLESDGNHSFRVSISINFPTCLLNVSGDGLSLKSLGDFFLLGKLFRYTKL